jgi:hypothetical protein
MKIRPVGAELFRADRRADMTKLIQWTLESRTQSVPRGGSTFNLFDFRVKCHEPHDAVQYRAHGSTFEFLFEFQTEFFSNFLFEFQVVRESNRSTFEDPLCSHFS